MSDQGNNKEIIDKIDAALLKLSDANYPNAPKDSNSLTDIFDNKQSKFEDIDIPKTYIDALIKDTKDKGDNERKNGLIDILKSYKLSLENLEGSGGTGDNGTGVGAGGGAGASQSGSVTTSTSKGGGDYVITTPQNKTYKVSLGEITAMVNSGFSVPTNIVTSASAGSGAGAVNSATAPAKGDANTQTDVEANTQTEGESQSEALTEPQQEPEAQQQQSSVPAAASSKLAKNIVPDINRKIEDAISRMKLNRYRNENIKQVADLINTRISNINAVLNDTYTLPTQNARVMSVRKLIEDSIGYKEALDPIDTGNIEQLKNVINDAAIDDAAAANTAPDLNAVATDFTKKNDILKVIVKEIQDFKDGRTGAQFKVGDKGTSLKTTGFSLGGTSKKITRKRSNRNNRKSRRYIKRG